VSILLALISESPHYFYTGLQVHFLAVRTVASPLGVFTRSVSQPDHVGLGPRLRFSFPSRSE
jgi:hypothetical protein